MKFFLTFIAVTFSIATSAPLSLSALPEAEKTKRVAKIEKRLNEILTTDEKDGELTFSTDDSPKEKKRQGGIHLLQHKLEKLRRPNRKITALPQSITYKKENDTHTYLIKGATIDKEESQKDLDDEASMYNSLDPAISKVAFSKRDNTITLLAKSELPFCDLSYVVDGGARFGGKFPHWKELEQRDTPKSKSFHLNNFTLKAIDKSKLPKDLKFEHQKAHFQSFFINTNTHKKIQLVFNRYTALCMCHSKQSLRILDKHGKLIWIDQSQLEGSMKFAVIPVKDSQTSRFYISTQHHHIEEKYFVLESNQR